jgi:fructosamine-3-kinase
MFRSKSYNFRTILERQPLALHLFVKTPPVNEIRRQMYNSAASFNRESYVYEHILPTLKNFQASRLTSSDQLFDKYPNLVAASCEPNHEFLVLKDLAEEGFKNAPKSSPLDFDHTALVLVNLAHLHAISFAMRDQKPELFATVTASLQETVFCLPVHEHLQTFLAKQVDYALTTLADDELELREKLLDFQKGFGQTMANITHSKEDAVVTHGDCWISNIMFREKV